MTLEEKIKASAEELRASGYPEDANRLEQDIDYVSRVWADSPADVALADDLGDLHECLRRMLAVLGLHVSI